MGILKNELKSKFTQIPNELLFDTRLSFGARILFCYLASKPDNWKIINQDIITSLKVSSDSVAKYFNELLDVGWVAREREINEKGQYCGGYNYTIYSEPNFSLSREKPNQEKVLIRKKSGNINNTNTTNNTDLLNNTKDINTLPLAKEKSIKPIINEIYELFSGLYKKHTGNKYLAKKHEFVLLTNIVKQFDKEIIINKIYLFEAMCENKVNYFTKNGFSDFTIGKLVSEWNKIVAEKEADGSFVASMFGEEE